MESNTMTELRKLFVDPSARDIAPGQIGGSEMVLQGEPREREMDFVLQTTDIARDGMVLIGRAFERRIDTFLRNPIMKISHLSVGPAGEPTGIGRWTNIAINDQGTRGTVRFSDATARAKEYAGLYRDGTYNMVSVEWITHAAEDRSVRVDSQSRRVPHITDAELLSADAVAIGSDRRALAMRAMGALERLSGRTGDDPAARTGRRLEELLGPALEQVTHRRSDIADDLARQRGTVLAGEPEDLAKFWKEWESKLDESVERSVKRIFNDDPDGMLVRLIAAVQASGRHGGQVDSDGDLYDDLLPPAARGEQPTGIVHLARALRGEKS